MMEILKKLTSLKLDLIYVLPGDLSIVSLKAVADAGSKIFKSGRVPPLPGIEAALLMLRMAGDGSNRASIEFTRGR